MSIDAQVSVREYLTTDYSPDCDYVDGVVEERNLGEYDHAQLQTALAAYLFSRRKQWGVRVVVEQRVQVAPTRFRIPDLCVMLDEEPKEQILTKPPFMCIEILSPEDRMSRMQERVNDYIRFGVPYVWILDPKEQKAYRCTTAGLTEVAELRTGNPEILVPLRELFE
jgi:Uma2 family endonuclease